MAAPLLVVRPATTDDSTEVIRLAALMYEAMGVDASGERWRLAGAAALESRPGGQARVLVVDDPHQPGRLVATGAGTISRRLPGPSNPAALVGYVQWVSTDPPWRRRGLARMITVCLLDWFAEMDVPSVELHATSAGDGLYRSLGFTEAPNAALRRLSAPG